MAFYYHDPTSTGGLDDGTSYTDAFLTFEQALAAANAAGDTIVCRANASETTPDTAAASRTFTLTGGSFAVPIHIIGVKSGTTNAGTSIVASDLTDRSVDQPVIEVTGAGNDMTWAGAYNCRIQGIKFIVVDRFAYSVSFSRKSFVDCEFECVNFRVVNTESYNDFIRCKILFATSVGGFQFNSVTCVSNFRYCDIDVTGGTTNNLAAIATGSDFATFIGCKFAQTTILRVQNSTTSSIALKFINCGFASMPGVINNSTPVVSHVNSVEFIGCNTTSSLAAGLSYQDYEKEDARGTIDISTESRSGGASDGATGAFSFAIAPIASSVAEGTSFAAESPWLRIWVSGGSITATIYTTHDNAGSLGRDLHQDELWAEFYYPDSGDTSQNILVTDPDGYTAINTATAVADDTGSTWDTLTTYNQKMTSGAVTTGYTGWLYAKVFVAHNSATPVTVYVDPLIEIT